MNEAEELAEQARRLPYGPERTQLHARAVDLAETTGDPDLGFQLKTELMQSAGMGGEPQLAMATFAWVRAKLDEEPERFAAYEYITAWVHKWMPEKASQFPGIARSRIDEIVDDLERRHVASGSGRRQAIAVRLGLELTAGSPPEVLAPLLADWRAAARTSLSDCEACEAALEGAVLIELGDDVGALAILLPYLAGDARFCAEGPDGILLPAVPLLLAEGRLEQARGALWQLINLVNRPNRLLTLGRLVNLLARSGEHRRAVELIERHLHLLEDPPSPKQEMSTSAGFAGALAMSGAADHPDLPRLQTRARELARQFADRNGHDGIVREVEGLLDPEPLPMVHLDPPVVAPPIPRVPVGAPETGDGEAGHSEVPERPAEAHAKPAISRADVPTASGREFDEWARGHWGDGRADEVEQAVAMVAADPSVSAEVEAVVAIWAARIAGPGDHPELERVVSDPDLPDSIRAAAGVLALGYLVDVGGDTADMSAMVDGLALDPSDEFDRRVIIGLDRIKIERRAVDGDHEGAAAAVEAIRELAAAGGIATQAGVEHTAVTIALERWKFAVSSELLDLDDEHQRLETALTRAVEWAQSCELRGWALGLASTVARAAIDVHLPELARSAALIALARIEDLDNAMALSARFSVTLTLADAVYALEGPAAALAPQREALAHALRMDNPHAIGWARRGLGLQLLAAERTDEASVMLAEAAELLADAGDHFAAVDLELRRGWVELNLDELDRADRIAQLARQRIDAIEPEELRRGFLTDALELQATVAEQAARWLEAQQLWDLTADAAVEAERPAAGYRSAAALLANHRGDVEAAFGYLDQADGDVQRLPEEHQSWYRARVAERRSFVLGEVGRLDEAVALASAAVIDFREVGDAMTAAQTGVALARLAERHQGAEVALEYFEQAVNDALLTDDTGFVSQIRWAWADMLESAGRTEAAAEQRTLAE